MRNNAENQANDSAGTQFTQPFYAGFADAYSKVRAGQAPNLALRFERLCPYGKDGTERFNFTQGAAKDAAKGKQGESGNPAAAEKSADSGKQGWLNQFDAQAAGNKDQLQAMHERQAQLCQQLGGQQFELKLEWRFLSGGGAHPLENSLIWHPTLGVPYLPGSAFKGLLHGFMEHWLGEKAKLDAYFGNTGQAGELLFFDVLPLAQVTLKADVMTPHYGNWYAAGGGDVIELRPENIPAPWHNPVPIPFLVVQAPLTLRAMLAPRGRSKVDWDAVEGLLKDAFAVAGAGAKTASGYGRMSLAQGWQDLATARAKQLPQLEAERQARLQRQERERKAQTEAAESLAKVRARAATAAAEAAKKQEKAEAKQKKFAEIKALPVTAQLPAFLQILRELGDGKALAGYLQGKNFAADLKQCDLALADVKAAMHADPAMLVMIRGWAGKKGNEGLAYEVCKPPKKGG